MLRSQRSIRIAAATLALDRVRVGGLRLERQFEVDFEHFVARGVGHDTEHEFGDDCGHESGVPVGE